MSEHSTKDSCTPVKGMRHFIYYATLAAALLFSLGYSTAILVNQGELIRMSEIAAKERASIQRRHNAELKVLRTERRDLMEQLRMRDEVKK